MFQEGRILIDADNAAVRADDLGGEQGDITYAGADVQDAHSGYQTRSPKEPLRVRTKDSRLECEACLFLRGSAVDMLCRGRLAHAAHTNRSRESSAPQARYNS
jgi:hypothetical protein